MIKKTLYFSRPVYLNLQERQFCFRPKDAGQQEPAAGSVPLEDLGFLVLDNPRITLSQPLLVALAENNTAVIFCDNSRQPRAMLLNLVGHSLQNKIIASQAAAKAPLKKRLWQQLVRQKLRNQAVLLKITGQKFSDIKRLAAEVKSGDSDNREAVAAKLYWRRLFAFRGKPFRRSADGDFPNSALNYGYAIIRAAVARALVGSGLSLSLGIHHSNQYNPFCLADDMIEPLRPLVDQAVARHLQQEPAPETVDRDFKRQLLLLLTADVDFAGSRRPLMVGLSSYSAGLARCYGGEQKQLTLPQLIDE